MAQKKRPERKPTPEQLSERQSWVGIDKIHLDMSGKTPTLSKAVPQVYIDLSSIAKGFGVDQVADVLEQHYVQKLYGGNWRGNFALKVKS